jgi:hypothetical protein
MASWRERESATQARSREDNESTSRARGGPGTDGGMSSSRCENLESERLMEEHDRFAVVETAFGEAAKS